MKVQGKAKQSKAKQSSDEVAGKTLSKTCGRAHHTAGRHLFLSNQRSISILLCWSHTCFFLVVEDRSAMPESGAQTSPLGVAFGLWLWWGQILWGMPSSTRRCGVSTKRSRAIQSVSCQRRTEGALRRWVTEMWSERMRRGRF